MTKGIGILFVIIACIFFLLPALAVVGSVFGVVMGAAGAMLGAVFGVIGAVFGAVFGVVGWIFDGLFDGNWHFGFFHCNPLTLAIIVIVIALIAKGRRQQVK